MWVRFPPRAPKQKTGFLPVFCFGRRESKAGVTWLRGGVASFFSRKRLVTIPTSGTKSYFNKPMNLLRKLYPPILVIILCLFTFIKAYTGHSIGLFVNNFFPCVQEPMESFPCFGIYDIAAMLLALVLGIVFIGIIIFRIIKFLKK